MSGGRLSGAGESRFISRRAPWRDRPVPESQTPRGRIAAAAVAFALFAGAAGLTWMVLHRIGDRPAGRANPWSWAPAGWTELPLPPEVRDNAAIVWTGQELVYWGGWPRGTSVDQARADGFAFDPASRTWRALPPAPIPGGGASASRDESGGAKTVWTGAEVLFWDVDTGAGTRSATLALDPTTGTWRRLDDSPHRGGAWAWTGQEVIAFGGGEHDSPSTVQGAALDPVTGAWEHIAEAPGGLNLANAMWTGAEVVVVGSELDNRLHAESPTAMALAYDPGTDQWRRLADAPLSPQSSEAVWFQGRVFAWDYGGDSAQYLPVEGRWQGLGKLPLDHGECYVNGVAIDGAVFAWNCGLPDAWYPSFGWRDVEGGPRAIQAEVDATYVGSYGRATAAGSVVIVEQVDNIRVGKNLHIGSQDGPVHLWAWRPPSSPSPPMLPTPEDAENLASNFLVAWMHAETYLPTLATQDVINRCRQGIGGCLRLDRGEYENWRSEAAQTAPGTFEVHVEFLAGERNSPSLTFVIGPGRTADGRDGDLVLIDVRSGMKSSLP